MTSAVVKQVTRMKRLRSIGAQAVCPFLLAVLGLVTWFALEPAMTSAEAVAGRFPAVSPCSGAVENAPSSGPGLDDRRGGELANVMGQSVALSAQTRITSRPSTCMAIDGDGHTVKTAASKMLFLWEGTPSVAYLVLTSCGVKSGKHHTVYVNGQPAVQVEDDPFSSACICTDEGQTGQGGQTVIYPLGDPGVVVNGWNYISVTNDHDLTDDWVAHDAKLALEGQVTQTVISTFSFTSSYDGSARFARYQLPIGYDPAVSVPLLVSIAGTKEDRKWEDLYRFAAEANERGWLLLSPNLRNLFDEVGGRTASLANQHDIIDAIDYVKTQFAVDTDRIYLSGFSTGGGVAATLAAKYPHMFAAVVDWAGPTDLAEWERQLSSMISLDFGCPPQGPYQCPLEWQRRSARSMTENLKHVPMAIVHGRADSSVPFEQSEKFYQKMAEYYDPATHNKLTVWHEGGHADQLPSFDGLDWMAGFTLNANPTDIMIRADEDKDYYWVTVHQRAWIGKFREGWSAVLASYDLSTSVISATIQDQRLYEDGFLPLDVSFDLNAMGFSPDAGYTIEDYNITTGEYVLRRGVHPVGGHLTLALERDVAGGVNHQYRIYPFEAPELISVSLQQHVSPSPAYDGVRDTHIYQYSPTQNYAADPNLVVNYGRSLRGLLEFDLGAIPPQADIKKVYLTLYLNAVSGGGSIRVGLYRLLSDWVDSEATWNLAAQGLPWAMPGAQGQGVDYAPLPVEEKIAYPNAFCSFNLKVLVKDWLEDEAPNEGLLILGPELGSGSTRYRFASSEVADASRRPSLDIWYMLPTATPLPSVTPTPTLTPTPTNTPEGCTIQGSVTLQGRPPPPNDRWSVPLTVTVNGTSYVVSTDQWGNFALAGLTPGSYDIGVKNGHTLRNLVGGVTLVAGTNAIDFGTLREGDATNDNYVNINDFSVLAAGFSPSYDPRADFNEDGVVNINDFSLLARNFGAHGGTAQLFPDSD